MTEIVYRWEGPPALRLERFTVDEDDRTWTQHRLVVQDGLDGAVVIAEKDGKVLLTHQFRPAVGESLWELPRGFGEPADVATAVTAVGVTAGARELLEETGLVLRRPRLLGRLWADSGLAGGRVAVIAGAVVAGTSARGTDGEVDAMRWVPTDNLRTWVATGEIRDVTSVAALGLWWAARR